MKRREVSYMSMGFMLRRFCFVGRGCNRNIVIEIKSQLYL